MFPDLIPLRTRLAAVDPTLVPLKDILSAWYEGSDRLAAEPFALPALSLEMSRRNPVLGAALGLGAVEAASAQADARVQAHAGAAMGIALACWGAFAEALPYLEQTIPALDGGTLLTARWHRLVCERHLGGSGEPAAGLLATADALEQAGDSLGAHRCRLEAAPLLAAQGRYEDALRLTQSARLHFVGRDLPGEEGIALATRGAMRIARGDLGPGQEDLNRAEDIFLRLDMPAMLCFVWLQRGAYYRLQQQAGRALHWLETARERAASLKHDFYRLLSLLDTAALLAAQGEVERGLEIHQTVRRIASTGRLETVIADSELTTANWLLRRGDVEAAAEGYRRARERYIALGSQRDAAICTLNLGLIASRQGNAAESARLLDEAQAAFEAVGLADG